MQPQDKQGRYERAYRRLYRPTRRFKRTVRHYWQPARPKVWRW